MKTIPPRAEHETMTPKKPKPERRVVSVAVSPAAAGGAVLAVLRPPDDPDLPDEWGLPAGRVHAGESTHAAALRTGREKLGVELGRLRLVASGTAERRDYVLCMDLYAAEIAGGTPSVPQPGAGVTQYAAWQWGGPDLLEPARDRGSLCCRLYLEAEG